MIKLRHVKQAMALLALASTLWAAPAVGQDSLSARTAARLSDAELSARVIEQLASSVVEVQREDRTEFGLRQVTLLLRPRAAPQVRGVCQAEELTITFRPESVLVENAFSAELAAESWRDERPADMAVAASGVRVTQRYRVVATPAIIEQIDPATDQTCRSITSSDGFILASDAYSIPGVLAKLEHARQALLAGSQLYTVTCREMAEPCATAIARLTPDRLTHQSTSQGCRSGPAGAEQCFDLQFRNPDGSDVDITVRIVEPPLVGTTTTVSAENEPPRARSGPIEVDIGPMGPTVS